MKLFNERGDMHPGVALTAIFIILLLASYLEQL